MRKYLSFILLVALYSRSWGQSYDRHVIDSIKSEGFIIYRLEAVSWKATDLLMKKEKDLLAGIKGYLSYLKGDSLVTIFYNNDPEPRVILTYRFESAENTGNVKKSKVNRQPDLHEKELVKIREDALSRINSDTTNFYRVYPNTSLNLVPVCYPTATLVFVLTGPTGSGMVPYGNDYVLYYSASGDFVKKARLHYGYIPTSWVDPLGKSDLQAMHNHINSDYITSTDIANTLLYRKFIRWTELVIVGREHTSIWNVRKNTLEVMTNMEYINSGQKKSNK
ncbi:MAG: hypothetical protein U0X39_11790 [Bacteroidales bacterium]